jgi:phosphoribosylamine--glycine ligase
MVQNGRAKVLEFNVRFGDPECQVLMMRLRSDIVDLMEACLDGTLPAVSVDWDARAAACVVLAAGGYPGTYEKGVEIQGLESLRDWKDGMVFHAGTAQRDSRFVTNGGRVLGVTALGGSIASAVGEAYKGVERIRWEGVHFRRDIGYRAVGAGGVSGGPR